jgi:hypothetical protein
LIKDLFYRHRDEASFNVRLAGGFHQLQLYINGSLERVTVDDFVPAAEIRGKLQPMCCMTGLQDEAWLAILEKACAKVFQGYQNLGKRHVLQYLRLMVPAPQAFLSHDFVDKETIWKEIFNHSTSAPHALESLIVASSGQESSAEEAHSPGAILCQVVKAVQTTDDAGRAHRLLLLRDMSERILWTGSWSAESPVWTSDLKKILSYSEVYAEGSQLFYCSFTDYMSYYNSTCIVKLHSPAEEHAGAGVAAYQRHTQKLEQAPDSFQFTKFTVPVAGCGKIYLTIHQVSKALAPPQAQYELSKARMVVGRVVSPNNIEYVKSATGTSEELTVELESPPQATYVAFLQVDWVDPYVIKQYAFSVYS